MKRHFDEFRHVRFVKHVLQGLWYCRECAEMLPRAFIESTVGLTGMGIA